MEKMEAVPCFAISFDLRHSRTQVVEDARICVFGRHISDPNRCSVMIMNSEGVEKVIADTDYRDYGAVACLNGEFALHTCIEVQLAITKGRITSLK